VSESCVVFRVLNEVLSEISNTESWFHIGAIHGGVFNIKVTVSLVSEMEKKYSGILLRFKEQNHWLKSTYIDTPGSSFIPSKPNEAPM
jgi:phage replication-related protein YjqB (UPF0714/DUF867 family)